MKHRKFMALVATGVLAFGTAACGDDDDDEPSGNNGGSSQELSGSIQIDGSSTVQPFAEAAAELYQEEQPNVRITVGGSGTGDGFERFCRGEIAIADASRAIEDDEREACQQGGVRFEEVQVANDGLAVVTNPDLEVDCMTTQQLKRLLAPGSNVNNYSALGGDFPDQPVSFFTPGTESGTYDYFTEEVLETDAEQRQSRVQTSANDNQLVTGISGTAGALGYVGFSFAEENQDQLNVVQVNAGEGCVQPTLETIQANEYPLSRPLFMYPSQRALQRPEVEAFMTFVIENQQRIAEAAQIVPLTEQQSQQSQQKIERLAQG